MIMLNRKAQYKQKHEVTVNWVSTEKKYFGDEKSK